MEYFVRPSHWPAAPHGYAGLTRIADISIVNSLTLDSPRCSSPLVRSDHVRVAYCGACSAFEPRKL